MGDPIKEFYQGIVKEKNLFSDESEFRNFMKDQKNSTEFFNTFVKEGGYFNDEKSYNNYFGIKKKDQPEPTTTVVADKPLQFPSPLEAITKKPTKTSAQSSQAPSPDFPSTYVSPYESETSKTTNEFSVVEGAVSEFAKYDNKARTIESTAGKQTPMNTKHGGSAMLESFPGKFNKDGTYTPENDPYWFEKQAAARANVKNNTELINKSADDIIQQGGGISAFIHDGDKFTFRKDKAIDLATPYIKSKGGDNYSTDIVVNEIRKRVEGDRDSGVFKSFLQEEYTKRGVDLVKYRDQLLNNVVQPKLAAMKDVEADRNAQIDELASVYKAEAKPLGDQYKQGVKAIQEAYGAGAISKEDADYKLNELNIDYKQAGDVLFNTYKKKGEDVMTKLRGKYERIYGEAKELEKNSQTYKAIVDSLPESERKKVEDSYKEAEARIGTYRNEHNKKMDKALMDISPALWLGKVVTNTWNSFAADMGDYMSMHDIDGSITRWAQGRRTAAGVTTMGQFDWSKDPMMRAITTTASTVVHPSTVLGIASVWAGGALGLPAIVTTVAAGTLAFELETKEQAGQSAQQQFEKTGDITAGIEAGNTIEQNLQVLRPIYFLGAVADRMLMAKGVVKKLVGAGVEVLEEYPTEFKQQYEAYKADGGKLGITDFVKDNPEMWLDVGVGILGQSAVVGGTSSAISKIAEQTPARRMQMFADMIQKGGVEYAMTNLKTQWQTGQITKEEFISQKDQLLSTANQLGKIKKLGLSDDDQKAFMAIGENHLAYSKAASKEKNPVIKQIYTIQAKQAQALMLNIAGGKGVYANVTIPGGGGVTYTMPVEKLSDEVIRNADKVEVKNNPTLDAEVKRRKEAMGNPENMPTGFYENEKKEEVVEEVEVDKPVTETIKEKFPFIQDTDFETAESFTTEEDTKFQEEMPESGFNSPEQLETFLKTGTYGVLTGQNPLSTAVSKEANVKLNESAKAWLNERGLTAIPVYGKYGNSERSMLVPNMSPAQAQEFAKEFGQSSVAHSTGLITADGKVNPSTGNITVAEQTEFDPSRDFYSTVKINGKNVSFEIGYDLDTTTDVKTPEQELTELFDSEINAKVNKVQQALESAGITVKLISDKEMSDTEGLNESGVDGLFTSEDGTIYLNRDRLRKSLDAATAIYHEGTHPIINIIKNTDPELYNRVMDGVKALVDTNKDVAEAKKWVDKQYPDYNQEERDDEFLVETIGRIASGDIDINKVDKSLLNSIYDLLQKIGRFFGIKSQDQGENIATFKSLAQNITDALVGGKDISTIVGAENVKEYQVGVQSGNPNQLRKADIDGEDVKVEDDYKLSFVTNKDIVDVKSIIKDIQDNNKKVWFWVGDQLGRGMYFDDVINGEHYLDAGASYALDPKNRDKGIIWASGMAKKNIKNNIAKSDYIFIISGSPATSKLFNKQVARLVFDRISKEGSYSKFKEDISAVSKVKPITNLLNEFNSFEELVASPKRKEFLSQINDQRRKNTPLKKTLEKYNAFVDYSELADDFYRNNDFKQNDIMLILKPTGIGGVSEHSTYENDILGEVVGVPDKKINAFDLMDNETREKHAELGRAQQSQVVAPYGSGVKKIGRQARRSSIEDDKNFKLTTYVFKKKSEGLTDAQIAASILSVFPDMDMNEVKSLVTDPSAYLNKAFAYLSPAVRANIVARAMVKDVYKATTFIDPAFSNLQVGEEAIEKATKKGDKKKRIGDWINSFKNSLLDPARGLPDWTLAMRDFATGQKNLEVIKAENVIRRLQKEASKIGFTDWENFSEAMKNLAEPMQQIGVNQVPVIFDPIRAAYNKPLDMPPATQHSSLAALPVSIKPFVFEMRAQIDKLTNELITSGYITPEQAIGLEKNLGAYVNRSYKAYNEKSSIFGGYRPSKEVFKEAVRIISNKKFQQISSQNPTMDVNDAMKQAAEEAVTEANKILSSKSSPYFGTSNKLDTRNTGILQQRQDIPEHIRKLLGEYTDPGTVFIMTVAKQAALVASSQYLSQLRKIGMGTLFFEANDSSKPIDFDTEVAPLSSESKSPLSGLVTSSEIAEALNYMEPTYNALTSVWMKLVGSVRWVKTVGSVVTQFKNFESNIGFSVMNGLWLTGKNGEALMAAAEYFKGQWSDKEISALTEKVNKLGLVGQSIGVRELSDMFKSGNIHDIALDMALNPKSKWQKTKDIAGKPIDIANKMYRLGDDFWKVYAYINESRQISKALYGEKYDNLTPQQQDDVDIEASERVKNTWPTYDRVVELAKWVSKRAPIAGNFLSFQAEAIRCLQNSVRYAVNDIKSDSPGFRAIGFKRLAGIGAYLGLRTTITVGLAKLAGVGAAGIVGSIFGDDDEERKKEGIKDALPSFMRVGDILVIPSKEKGKFTVYNLSSIDPYGVVFNTMNALTEGSEDQDPGVTAAMSDFISNFIEPEMTFRNVWSALVDGEDARTGRKILKDGDHGFEAAMKIGGTLWNNLEPSTISSIERLIERENKGAELASFAGARPYDVDLYRSYQIKLSQSGKKYEDISDDYYRAASKPGATADDIAEAKAAADTQKSYLIDEMNRLRENFILLGCDPAKFEEMVIQKATGKGTGFDPNTKDGLLGGNYSRDLHNTVEPKK